MIPLGMRPMAGRTWPEIFQLLGPALGQTLQMVGIVFVIDTTLSMQPYIDSTREAVETIRKQIEATEAGRGLGRSKAASRSRKPTGRRPHFSSGAPKTLRATATGK